MTSFSAAHSPAWNVPTCKDGLKQHRLHALLHSMTVSHYKRGGRVSLVYPAEKRQLECGPMPSMMAALPNIGGALCSTRQSAADAYYKSAVQ